MSDMILCPYCKEEIQRDAKKCKHCHEFISSETPAVANMVSDEKFKAILELIGKAIIPLVIAILVLSLKPTLVDLFGKTKSAKFMGVEISFEKSSGFQGDLTPLALYRLIGSADGGSIRYESEDDKKYVNELTSKGLVTIKIEETKDGSPEMIGTWVALKPTDKGREFLANMGVKVR
ncbi:hypothetical protein KY945_004597 [Vibrio parahaemolyticus]|uniref:hypothetical protein n=1 Tax=Vibrio parahaemolyticus TaxID=670 RepID=UPI00084B39B5|nr:hypothetical protein [Vibrio parahaemolyticus]EHU5175937.1 hypothetical protein [Vibrio parahaemolyticus]EHV5548540.1 hypothetical protein [Vibrio parahaemolyticus]ODX73369.1 hypothetical protein BBM10_13580 [Vibrio parahaemolyticus]ODX76189.1 hypothetical protein BBM11_05390 [Vibrio parahaemolyticus]